MKTILRLSATALCALCLVVVSAGIASAASVKQHIVGTWAVVSTENVKGSTKTQPLGPHPVGYFMFDRSGHFSGQMMSPDLPKFAANNKNAGTDAENKAVVQGMISTFGTYAVNEKDHSMTVHIIGSSFPNWSGTDQKRMIAFSGDTMTLTAGEAATGGIATISLKRAK